MNLIARLRAAKSIASECAICQTKFFMALSSNICAVVDCVVSRAPIKLFRARECAQRPFGFSTAGYRQVFEPIYVIGLDIGAFVVINVNFAKTNPRNGCPILQI